MNRIFTVLVFAALTLAAFAEDNLERAIELYENGEKQASYNILQKLYKETPDDPGVNYYLGMLFTDLGELVTARDLFLKTESLDDRYRYVASELSYIYLQLGEFDRSVAYAKKSIGDYPDHVSAYLNLATILNAEKKWDEFERYLSIAAEKEPHYVLSQADTILTQYNRPDIAIEYYKVLYKVIPHDSQLLHHLGGCYYMQKDYEKAYQYYEEAYDNAVFDKETFFVIYASYMWSLLRQNQYQKIREEAFRKADKDYDNAYYYIALSYFMEKNDALFRNNADQYFRLKKEKPPADLMAWAEKIMKNK
jgi:tetratricopeptide (TPR) repeat protein